MKKAHIKNYFTKFVIVVYARTYKGTAYDIEIPFTTLSNAQEEFNKLVKKHTDNDDTGAIITLYCMTCSKEDFSTLTEQVKISQVRIAEE